MTTLESPMLDLDQPEATDPRRWGTSSPSVRRWT